MRKQISAEKFLADWRTSSVEDVEFCRCYKTFKEVGDDKKETDAGIGEAERGWNAWVSLMKRAMPGTRQKRGICFLKRVEGYGHRCLCAISKDWWPIP